MKRKLNKKNHLGVKKAIITALCLSLLLITLSSCGQSESNITVISREDGSGTRGAFTEILGIAKDGVDNTTQNSEISQSTSVVMTTVEGNKNAIGYVSAGSLKKSVKALKVDGYLPTTDNIKAGDYPVARPFLLVTNDNQTNLSKDFIKYIMSKEGQEEVQNDGYVPVDDVESLEKYVPQSGLSGKIVVVGSTSVAPLLQKIADNYRKINPQVVIEIQQPGSGAGITSVSEKACDIGMSSRELKDEEIKKGLECVTIAMDGIAVVINKENEIEELTSEEIKNIFTGEITEWSQLGR